MRRAKTGLMLGVGALALAHAVVAAAHDWRAAAGALLMDACATPLLAVGVWRLRHDHAPLPWPSRLVTFLAWAMGFGATVFLCGSVALLLAARSAAAERTLTTAQRSGDIDYLVVLGAGLSRNRVNATLSSRLDCAEAWLLLHRDTPVVVSGGMGSRESVTEAEAMAAYLIEKGVAPARILREETSRSTWENMRNTRALLSARIADRPPRVLVATSNFHLFRSLFLARRAGLDPQGLACPTPWHQLPNLLVRECLAVVKSWTFDRPTSP